MIKSIRLFSLGLALFAMALPALSQDNSGSSQSDSARFVNADWHLQKVAGGTYFRQYAFVDTVAPLFKSNQVISILALEKGALTGEQKNKEYKYGRRVVDIVTAGKLATVSYMAKSNEAIASVNGSFFDMDMTKDASVTYFRVDNKELAANRVEKQGDEYVIKFMQTAAVATKGGRLFIVKADAADPDWVNKVDAEDMLCTGPLLIYNGEKMPLEEISFNTKRHNRTGVAALADGTLLLIVADGRSKEASGLTMKEFQQIGSWLGAVDMVNMDGGGSSTMYVVNRGVVNYPSDNKTFDHNGERPVANAIIISFRKN